MFQFDHNLTMNNPEFLVGMRATEESIIAFANSLDPKGMLCDTASHCDPRFLTFEHNKCREYI